MRVHSAGHLIDFSLYLLGYSPRLLSPIKADHGKKPFIMYQGVVSLDIKDELQQKVDELVEQNRTFSWKFDLLENIRKECLYLQPGLPQNKPLRTLTLDGVGTVADGGTIVRSTKELGNIILSSIEVVNGTTAFYYFV